ncbi:BEN domain-containing protein 7 isoform X1 [Petromyzon marinus]|uniref:BEN domain-containing protein 7 isoform X1 n=1 Tax=Petromyzon marinus TaxID=7757 RepID=UPI003F725705
MEVAGRKRKRKSPSSKLRKSNAFAEENSTASDLEYPMQEKHVAVSSGATRCLALDEAMANGSGRVHVFPSGDGTQEGSINNGNSHHRTISSQPSAHPSKADASQQQSRADQDLTAMPGIPVQPNPNDIKTEPEEDNQSGVLWENPEDNNGLHLSTTDDVEFHQLSMLESLAGHWNDDGSRNQHLIPQSFTNSSTGIASSPRENPDREPVCDMHDLSMHRCKCSCEPLLHSILHELKSIRELMQSQTAAHPDVCNAAVQTNATADSSSGRVMSGQHLIVISGGPAPKLAATLAPGLMPTPASSTQLCSSSMGLTNGSPGTPLKVPHARIASAVGHAPLPAGNGSRPAALQCRRGGFQSGELPHLPRPCTTVTTATTFSAIDSGRLGGRGLRHQPAINRAGCLGLNLSRHGQVQVLGVDAGAAVFPQVHAGGLERGGGRMPHAEQAPLGQALLGGGAPGTACRLPDTQCRQASRIRIESVKTLVVAAAAGPMAGPAEFMAQEGRKAIPAGKHTFQSRAEQGASRTIDSMERPGPNSAGLAASAPVSTVGIQERSSLALGSPGNPALENSPKDGGHFTENCFYSLGHSPQSDSTDLAVQLADGYNVFMARSQLEEILMHYTRSGSLLFRKLVAAFFDDHTLANSLPNGKRKRGFNDPRKGLEPNIVAAIRSFTESYCKNKKIMKLPGPKDWVQLLQDQIKLARRRIRRVPPHNMRLQDSAEAFEGEKGKLE